MRRNLALGLLGVLFAILVAEIAARTLLGDRTASETRPYEPFFVSGDYFGRTSLDRLRRSREGPGAYGYSARSGLYLHDQLDPERRVDWRSRFLFDHYLSRYSADDVDRLVMASPDSLFIYVLGGSVAQGSSASSKETTWHALLEGMLREKLDSADIYVFNCAMGAFVSSQERLAFDLAVAPRKPGFVIILNGFNDILNPLNLGVSPGDPMQVGKRYAQVYDVSLLRFVRARSGLLRYFHNAAVERILADYKQWILDGEQRCALLVKGVVDVYLANARHLIERGHQMGSQVHVLFQPWRDLTLYRTDRLQPDPELEFGLAVLERVRVGMEAESDASRFHDVTGSLDIEGGVETYTDLVHVDDRGQRILAQAIFTELAPAIARSFEAQVGGGEDGD